MDIPCKSLSNNVACEQPQFTREWHAKRDGRERARARARVGGGGEDGRGMKYEIGSLIADTESMLRDCDNSNLREGT